jgi:2-oxoglutarate ferredoxin oxidoreductase subunit alpha
VIFPHPSEVKIEPRRQAEPGDLVFGGETVPPMMEFGRGGYVHVTGSTHLENGLRDVQTQAVHDRLVRRLVAKIADARDAIADVEIDRVTGARVGVLAYGATARPAKGAVLAARAAGLAVDFCRPVSIWPFPVKQVREACAGLDILVVPEMNLGQLSREIERHVDCEVRHAGKIGGVVHSVAEIREQIDRAAAG